MFLVKLNLPLIKKMRVAKGLNINQMAEFLNLSNSSQYWKRENGDYNFKISELPILSERLDIPFNKLFLSNQYSKTEISKAR